jgi:hypothetical protein
LRYCITVLYLYETLEDASQEINATAIETTERSQAYTSTLLLSKTVLASNSYHSEFIGPIIASYSYRSGVVIV